MNGQVESVDIDRHTVDMQAGVLQCINVLAGYLAVLADNVLRSFTLNYYRIVVKFSSLHYADKLKLSNLPYFTSSETGIQQEKAISQIHTNRNQAVISHFLSSIQGLPSCK